MPRAPSPCSADGAASALTSVLQLLIERLYPAASGGKPPLGPVNGALGTTVGNLLNGRKSAIGIIGAALTQILGTAPSATVLSSIAGAAPALAGTSGTFLPIFIALAAWGPSARAKSG